MSIPESGTAVLPPGKPQCGGVDVWWIDLDMQPAAARQLAPVLGAEELERASGLRHPLDRHRYIVAHGALRSILARYLGTTSAGVGIRPDPRGRPELDAAELRFSLSRSGGLAVAAVARTVPVGVDVERVRLDADPHWLDSFSPEGCRALARFPEPERGWAFFRGWTRMEAVLKAAGGGLEQALGMFHLFLTSESAVVFPPFAKGAGGRVWHCHDLRPRPGYTAALASGATGAVRHYWWPGSGRLGTPHDGRPRGSAGTSTVCRAKVVI